MSYYLVNVATKKRFTKTPGCGPTTYRTLRGALIALNRRKLGASFKAIAVDTYNELYPPKMVERTNLMSGEKYFEAEDTPVYLSPASETYWCR
jgi:hypothetical protein